MLCISGAEGRTAVVSPLFASSLFLSTRDLLGSFCCKPITDISQPLEENQQTAGGIHGDEFSQN